MRWRGCRNLEGNGDEGRDTEKSLIKSIRLEGSGDEGRDTEKSLIKSIRLEGNGDEGRDTEKSLINSIRLEGNGDEGRDTEKILINSIRRFISISCSPVFIYYLYFVLLSIKLRCSIKFYFVANSSTR